MMNLKARNAARLADLLLIFAACAWHAPRTDAGEILRDLPYVEKGHERQRLDLYLPEKTQPPAPVIVWVHGGAWKEGSKNRCPAAPFAQQGYAVASINYRLSQDAPFPAQIEDCKAAVRWLRANAQRFHLNPERIGAWGGSAGGHLVALLGTTADVPSLEGQGGHLEQSSRVQAVVDWYGRIDLTMASQQNNASVTAAVSALLGGPVDADRERALRASPNHYVTAKAAPFLIIHGDKDPRVPLEQSQIMNDALKKAGVEVSLHIVEGGGHGGKEFSQPANWRWIDEFFAKHLLQ